MENKDYLRAAADAVMQQVSDGLAVPVDPDVADFMGAFTEEAVTLDDMVDDVLLSINDQGEAICHEE